MSSNDVVLLLVTMLSLVVCGIGIALISEDVDETDPEDTRDT